MAKVSLGRGFDALIPKDLDPAILEEDKHRVQSLPVGSIASNPRQPRREFNDKAHDELTESVKTHGVLQPIIVVRSGNGYRIVAGERRWRAATSAKLTHIPAIVRSLKELEQIELALIENIQRVDLSPLEQALSVYHLQQQFNLKLDDIAKKLGKAPSTLSNLTRLLQLPDEARDALSRGQISEGHARAIMALKARPDKQAILLSSILDNGWTVRQAEQFVIGAKKDHDSKASLSRTSSENDLTRRLSKQLNVPVKLKHTAKELQLIISLSSEQELQKLADRLHQSVE